jgi:hypothetical protein
MLKLNRIDIQGFKSLYDRTDMKFHGVAHRIRGRRYQAP